MRSGPSGQYNINIRWDSVVGSTNEINTETLFLAPGVIKESV